MTQARVLHHDLLVLKVAEILDGHLLVFGGGDTLGEQGNGCAAIMTELLFIDVSQAEDKVGTAFFQVLKHFLVVFQADFIWDVKFVHQQADQVNTISLWLALLI